MKGGTEKLKEKYNAILNTKGLKSKTEIAKIFVVTKKDRYKKQILSKKDILNLVDIFCSFLWLKVS